MDVAISTASNITKEHRKRLRNSRSLKCKKGSSRFLKKLVDVHMQFGKPSLRH